MTIESPPTGQPYSRVYQVPAELRRDSERARIRLGAVIDGICSSHDMDRDIAARLEQLFGVAVPFAGSHVRGFWPDWRGFFRQAALDDVLDAVTGLKVVLSEHSDAVESPAEIWRVNVHAIFSEEAMGYRVDAEGGVHPVVDSEFEALRVASLRLLGDPKYGGVLRNYEEAHRHFEARNSENRAAIRAMFDSLEGLVRIMTGRTVNLGRRSVMDQLGPCIAGLLGAAHQIEAEVTNGMLATFAEWANTLHPFRHGQPHPDPVAPSPELTAFILSSGASYLRWLLEIDQRAASLATTQAGGNLQSLC